MRNWILKLLGAVDKELHLRLYHEYAMMHDDINRAIEIHGMQSAWSEAQRERKERRWH